MKSEHYTIRTEFTAGSSPNFTIFPIVWKNNFMETIWN